MYDVHVAVLSASNEIRKVLTNFKAKLNQTQTN